MNALENPTPRFSPASFSKASATLEPARLLDSSVWPGSAIFHRARQLIGHAGLVTSDLDDLQQDLIVHALLKWPKFDPMRASARTFLDRILHQRQRAILRQRRLRARRTKPVPLKGDLSEDRRRHRQSSHVLAVDRQLDLSSVVDAMSLKERQVARGLMKHKVSKLAKLQKRHRQRLHETIRRIRQRLEDAELREYLS